MEDNDCPALVRNLSRVREVWKRTTRILRREGEKPQVYGFFFKDVVQAVLLFGLETWVVTPPPPAQEGTWGGSRTRWRGGSRGVKWEYT